MTFERDDLDELLGAYALDAVDTDERRRVEEYLSLNPRARAEVEQHREVATMLSYSGAPAPDGLWDRIAESLDDRAPEPGPELAKVMPLPVRPPVAVPAPAPDPSVLASGRRRAWRLASAVAAAAAVVIGLLSWRLVDTNNRLVAVRSAQVTLKDQYERIRKDDSARRAQLLSSDGAQHATALVTVDGTGYLDGSPLAVLDPDHTYQLWGVVQGLDGQQVISLGVLGPHFDVAPFTVRQGTLVKLVLTEEARGGVPVSKQPAALAGDLT